MTKQLLIQAAPGFTPHIGVLVSTLQTCREKTIQWCQDLTLKQLDYLWDEIANTIGALLLHLAALEVVYHEYTFYGRSFSDNPARMQHWDTAVGLGEAARILIRGYPIAYYLAELATIRESTLNQFKQLDDSWLWQEHAQKDVVANNYWMWYHVYEDEINHRGEISWLKSRIPAC